MVRTEVESMGCYNVKAKKILGFIIWSSSTFILYVGREKLLTLLYKW